MYSTELLIIICIFALEQEKSITAKLNRIRIVLAERDLNNKRSPDNNILTVALKFKDENRILLTSDNGFQVKAKGLNMKTISLKDFLKK